MQEKPYEFPEQPATLASAVQLPGEPLKPMQQYSELPLAAVVGRAAIEQRIALRGCVGPGAGEAVGVVGTARDTRIRSATPRRKADATIKLVSVRARDTRAARECGIGPARLDPTGARIAGRSVSAPRCRIDGARPRILNRTAIARLAIGLERSGAASGRRFQLALAGIAHEIPGTEHVGVDAALNFVRAIRRVRADGTTRGERPCEEQQHARPQSRSRTHTQMSNRSLES